MELKKLVEAYKRNIEDVLSNPELYNHRTVKMARILARQEIEDRLKELAEPQ